MTSALRALDAAKVRYEARCYNYTEHGGTGQALDHPLQERIMGTAEDDGVGPGFQKGLQGSAHDGFRFGAVEYPLLHQFHEALTHVFRNGYVVLVQASGIEVLGPF